MSYINPCFRLPDLLALSSPEIELPTLAMDSDSLSGISLSGIINQFIHLPQVVMMMMIKTMIMMIKMIIMIKMMIMMIKMMIKMMIMMIMMIM